MRIVISGLALLQVGARTRLLDLQCRTGVRLSFAFASDSVYDEGVKHQGHRYLKLNVAPALDEAMEICGTSGKGAAS